MKTRTGDSQGLTEVRNIQMVHVDVQEDDRQDHNDVVEVGGHNSRGGS